MVNLKLFALALAMLPAYLKASPQVAMVQLFEWSWKDVAEECQYLGDWGYNAVQVSPPQASIDGEQWWTRYQPLAYSVEGRGGSADEFLQMVSRCGQHDIDIYVDVVINHMAALSREFPRVPYETSDFHDCFEPMDFNNRRSVHFCDLLGLNDLKTESTYVRSKIAGYLNRLIEMGVGGFRIDAAKHMPISDILAIKKLLIKDVFIYQEVVGSGGEPISKFEYTPAGAVTEFNYGRLLGAAFKGKTLLKELRYLKDRKGWLRSSQAIVFTDNHDTQRSEPFSVMTFKDYGARYFIANTFMLAYPYGYPRVMSSFSFEDKDQGPPQLGVHTGSKCYGGQWMCEHRWDGITAMVGFRKATMDKQYLNDWWDNGGNQIAFSRGNLGFVAINGEDFEMNELIRVGLPDGRYCNVIAGPMEGQECKGGVVMVRKGRADVYLSALNALAIHHKARLNEI